MPLVTDRIGRTHSFQKIRFKFDEDLLQQASLDVVDGGDERPQMVFDRYNKLHFMKYGRNFEPAHFLNGKLRDQFKPIYDANLTSLRVVLEITSDELTQKYLGYPASEIEEAVKRNPDHWVQGATVVAMTAAQSLPLRG